ncbi:MAG: sulfatase [Opitutaceae bacterium]
MKPTSLTFSAALLAGALGVSAAEKPNVLFIAVDDLAAAIGCYGDAIAKTPHLDRLAASGVRFDRAYNQLPLCNPSRASVLTGLRPDTTKVYDLERHFRDELPAVVTLPQAFRRAGWWTGRVGKIYHYDVPRGIGTNGLDDAPSWDQVVNPRGRDVTEEAQIVNPTPTKPVSAALSWLAAEGTDAEQTDGMVATEAIRLMTEQRDRPFFLGVGFFRPHTPYVAPKKYFDLYPLEKIRLPAAPAKDRDDIPSLALAHNNLVPNYGLDELSCRRALQAYYACVSFVDAQVGRVLDALDHLGLAQNTIVVLWSDHGYHLGEHLGAWQKRTLFEEAARAPLFIRGPRAAGNGRASPAVVEFVDIYPTIAELAGVPAPADLAGRSLVPLLENPTRTWSGQAFSQVLRPNDGHPVMGRSVRTERWRYTEWDNGRAGVELYDHDHDPHEFNNLARDPAQQTTRANLRALFTGRIAAEPPVSPVKADRL